MPLTKWSIAVILGALFGSILFASIDLIGDALDVDWNWFTKFLVFCINSFCSLLGAAIVNGFSGKGFKVILN